MGPCGSGECWRKLAGEISALYTTSSRERKTRGGNTPHHSFPGDQKIRTILSNPVSDLSKWDFHIFPDCRVARPRIVDGNKYQIQLSHNLPTVSTDFGSDLFGSLGSVAGWKELTGLYLSGLSEACLARKVYCCTRGTTDCTAGTTTAGILGGAYQNRVLLNIPEESWERISLA